jgi:hypothetical protein
MLTLPEYAFPEVRALWAAILRTLLHATAAHTRRAASLPAAAAAPVLRLNLSLYSDVDNSSPSSSEVAFQALLRHETDVAAAASADARLPHVLCGPQRKASSARAAIATYAISTSRVRVLFASRSDDVACWGARLRLVDATALKDAHVFFHVAPVPAAAKLSPYLIELSHTRDTLIPTTGVFAGAKTRRGLDGLTAVLYRDNTNSSAMLEEWARQKFGKEVFARGPTRALSGSYVENWSLVLILDTANSQKKKLA